MKIDRLFEITFILIDRKSITAKELAEMFCVSVRTIYRDMDILSACGVPVYTEKGRNGGIHIMEEYSINKALFTDREQSQIVMALQSINALGQSDVSTTLSKMKGIFKKDFDDWIEIDFSSWSNSDKDKMVFSIIREGIIESQVISFSYYSSKGEKTNRRVDPYKLVFKGNSWYLFAYCRDKKDFRFFKLTRMEELAIDKSLFVKQKLESAIKNEYVYTESKVIELKLEIHEKMAFRVKDEFKEYQLDSESDKFIVQMKVSKEEWIIPYLLSYGDSIKVIEPLEIKEEYLRIIKNIYQVYTNE